MKSRTTLKSLGFVLVLTLGLLIAAPGRLPRMFATEAAAMFAPQATITVNSTADGAPANNGACTLREALMNANGANQSGSTDCAAGGTATNTITFSLPAGPQTITLTGALPDITSSLTITGPGAGLLTVTRPPGVYNNSATWYRIFTIPIGGLNIAISGLTVSNGYLNGMDGSGGGIRSYSNLTLTNCAIANNTSLGGGGVHVGGADAVFTGCTFSGNWSANTGGAIIFSGNTLLLINSTISNNFGSSGGGGILNVGNTVEVTNCTIANNTQYLNGSGFGSGILTGAGTTRLRNTIIANNNWPNLKTTGSASIVSLGNNLTSDEGGGVLNQPGDKINTDPLLAPLGNYGGATQTLALLPSSPALNAGNNCVLTNNCASNNLGFNLITDQRGAGFNRQIGAVDMGAFESRFTIAIFTGASTAAANERTTNATYTFADTIAGNSTAQTFTIKNTGTANLTGIVVTITGEHPTDFVLNALGATTLAPNATTTFTVSFKPLWYGVRNAVINIASNEADPTPFVINVSGTGVNTLPTITASNLTCQKGSPAANNQIATVMDAQDPEQILAVTVNGGASATVNGVTISNLTVNTTGQVRADVAATSTATNASFTLTVSDYVGATANATLNVTVPANAAPTISSNTIARQAGSSAASFTIATAVDFEQAVNTLGITINGNPTSASSNGVTVSGVTITPSGAVTANISTTCAATSATFTLVVTDNENATGTGTLTVNVQPNQPPVVSMTGPASGAIYAVGTPINFTGSFTDSSDGPHTATWTFDTITQPGVVDESAGTVSGAYTFTQAGVYQVALAVSDSCGEQGVVGATAMVVIYDPSAGYVTGNGWIVSPPGAYVPNPSLTGNATFGFVSKYKKGATEPTGDTEFQFALANLGFKSTAYEWLVVSGARAQFKGSGTINDQGDYRFILTAVDGKLNGGDEQDKFRIRIWDNQGGGLVYDNQLNDPDSADPTTVIGGGKIVIRTNGNGNGNNLAALSTQAADEINGEGRLREAEVEWQIVLGGEGGQPSVLRGGSGAPYFDVIAPGDYDGDGQPDLAIFRRANGQWLIKRSTDGGLIQLQWGAGADLPAAADYDGDGKTDIAVWRGATGQWFILRSSDGAKQVIVWGAGSAPYNDQPAPADYDGDGRADVAVWRAAEGKWYALGSSSNSVLTKTGEPPATAIKQ